MTEQIAPVQTTTESEGIVKSGETAVKATVLSADADKSAEVKAKVDDKAAAETPEAKASREKAEADKSSAERLARAPEKYEAFKLPEGMPVDQKALDAVAPLLKKHGLTQVEAQEMIDVYAKSVGNQVETFSNQMKEWTEKSKSDSEFGGQKFDENIKTAQKAMATFATPELKGLLDQSGLGNHPDVIRFFYRVGKAISEDKMVRATDVANAPKSIEDRLYGGKK